MHPVAQDNRLPGSFSAKILVRGKDLYASGKVLKVSYAPTIGEAEEEAHFTGEVLGSTHKIYTQSLTFYKGDIESFCTCPYEFQCKHGAALAMKVISDPTLAQHLPLPPTQQHRDQDSRDWDDHDQNQHQVTQVGAQLQDDDSGWFNLQLDITVGGMTLPTAEVVTQWLAMGAPEKMALQNAEQQWVMADMSALLPIFTTLKELFGGSGKPSTKLPNFRISALAELDNVNFRGAPELKKLQEDLQNFKGLKVIAPPKALNATLRDYQQQGLNWLMFLHRYRFGGILADDMGLGKTLQALAFLQKIKANQKLQKGALVVAPTSLIWNWETEAAKFTPQLKCLVIHGPERHKRFDHMANYDLVITSYPLLHRDIDFYAPTVFDAVILDEAQNVKNPLAKTARAVRQLQADMRVALTGTPLENHLGELWSIMDFALPSLLGSSEFFQQHFRKPIEIDRDMERNRDLAQRAAPFMLRRTKQAVATELPDKTEILQHVHLEKDQHSLYESIRISMEKKVRALIKTKGMARSHIEFLDALLKLRQACIDPRLVKLQQAKKAKTSAKMNWLIENLPEMVEEGRKVLVFSQFTQMLGLIEQEIEHLKIPYAKLTGQTKNRKAAVEQFQSGAVPVFLVSLKAGGSGLNLTAADTVIHVDPWWNPAVENQATDRAYRIGQDKPVFVYKLVAAGTVEERIQAMQEQKQSLADALFDNTQKTKLPKSGDELLALFR